MPSFMDLPCDLRMMTYPPSSCARLSNLPMQTRRHEIGWASKPNVQAKCTEWEVLNFSILQVNHLIRDEALPIFYFNDTGIVCDKTREPYRLSILSCLLTELEVALSRMALTNRRIGEAYRTNIIDEIYPSLLSHLANIQIDFNWESEAWEGSSCPPKIRFPRFKFETRRRREAGQDASTALQSNAIIRP